jgi:outer membrane protein assembly factor BamB
VTLWDHKLPDQVVSDATLLVDGGTLYLAHYSAISDGAVMHALDLATGAERWSTPVRGLGGAPNRGIYPNPTGIYSNHVMLRMVQGYLVVFGSETGGDYIEVFDPVTGKMQSTALHPVTIH